jgi:hypothetical protein
MIKLNKLNKLNKKFKIIEKDKNKLKLKSSKKYKLVSLKSKLNKLVNIYHQNMLKLPVVFKKLSLIVLLNLLYKIYKNIYKFKIKSKKILLPFNNPVN